MYFANREPAFRQAGEQGCPGLTPSPADEHGDQSAGDPKDDREGAQ
jgi:hypothetical protein